MSFTFQSTKSNFNGLKLLDGSLIKSTAGVTSSAAGAISSNSIGTLGTSENGVMTKGSATVNSSSKFYVGDIKNNNAAAKSIMLSYKNNTGATKTVTMNVAAGATFDASGIVAALNLGTDNGLWHQQIRTQSWLNTTPKLTTPQLKSETSLQLR